MAPRHRSVVVTVVFSDPGPAAPGLDDSHYVRTEAAERAADAVRAAVLGFVPVGAVCTNIVAVCPEGMPIDRVADLAGAPPPPDPRPRGRRR